MKSYRLTREQENRLRKLLQEAGPVYVIREVASFVLNAGNDQRTADEILACSRRVEDALGTAD